MIFSILIILALLVIVISIIANNLFNKMVKAEVRNLFSTNVYGGNEIIKESHLKDLPDCVQKWLKYSQIIGKERIKTACIEQKAILRLQKGKPWMSTEAIYYYTIDEPAFIWKAKIKAAPLIHIAGRDMYYKGKGNMLIKLLSLITVADAKGDEIDQGTLLRYLGESVWFPTAALNHYIEWKEIDSNSAQATMSYGGVTASGIFKFNEKGEVISFTAERFMESKGQYSMETWLILLKNYKKFDGIKIPTEGEVIWKLDTGDFNWYNFKNTNVEYNISDIK